MDCADPMLFTGQCRHQLLMLQMAQNANDQWLVSLGQIICIFCELQSCLRCLFVSCVSTYKAAAYSMDPMSYLQLGRLPKLCGALPLITAQASSVCDVCRSIRDEDYDQVVSLVHSVHTNSITFHIDWSAIPVKR